jgi:hypothetical protein
MAGVKCLNIIAHVQEVTPRNRTQDASGKPQAAQ